MFATVRLGDVVSALLEPDNAPDATSARDVTSENLANTERAPFRPMRKIVDLALAPGTALAAIAPAVITQASMAETMTSSHDIT
jgi:hypothetical protein